MTRLPTLTSKKIITALKRAGFEKDIQNGSHLFFWHPIKKLRTCVPVHAGKDISRNPTRTVTAGSWVTLEFTLPSEPAISFNAGDGVLAAGKGVLEHLALVPTGGMGAYNVYLDNFQIVYTQSMPSTINMNSDSILSFTASATDSDTPAQTLSFSLDAGAPISRVRIVDHKIS